MTTMRNVLHCSCRSSRVKYWRIFHISCNRNASAGWYPPTTLKKNCFFLDECLSCTYHLGAVVVHVYVEAHGDEGVLQVDSVDAGPGKLVAQVVDDDSVTQLRQVHRVRLVLHGMHRRREPGLSGDAMKGQELAKWPRSAPPALVYSVRMFRHDLKVFIFSGGSKKGFWGQSPHLFECRPLFANGTMHGNPKPRREGIEVCQPRENSAAATKHGPQC